MPCYRIGRDRESLHYTGEQYKQAVASWLESKGMKLVIDSAIEGTFEDLVLIDSNGNRVFVECKDTDISINSEKFLRPFGWFLSQFNKLPSSEKFQFYFVAKKVEPWDLVERIFAEYDKDEIQHISERSKFELSKSNQQKIKRASKALENLSNETLVSFVNNTHVVWASYEKLQRLSRFPPSMSTSIPISSPLNVEDIQHYLRSLTEVPTNQEILVTNIFQTSSIPDNVFLAPSDVRSEKELLSYVNEPVFPFILRKGLLITFSDLKNPKNKLSEFVEQSLVKTDSIHNVFIKSDRKYWLIHLMNNCLFSHMRSLGMISQNRNQFFFPPVDGKQLFVHWFSGIKRSEREITTFKTKEGHKGFWKQRTISVEFRFLNGDYVLVLKPGFIFTTDGKTAVNPKLMTKLSSRTWARYGNNYLLNDVRFWINFISNDIHGLKIETGDQPITVRVTPNQIDFQYGLSGDYSPHLTQPIDNPRFRRFWRSLNDDTIIQTEFDDTGEYVVEEQEDNGAITFMEDEEFDWD